MATLNLSYPPTRLSVPGRSTLGIALAVALRCRCRGAHGGGPGRAGDPVGADVLDDLVETVQETVHLDRLDADMIVYLAKREAAHPLRLVSAVGVFLPAAATALGKALLADRPAFEVETLLPRELPALTPTTLTSRDALLEQLDAVRAAGYAVDREESTPGVRCFAVTVGRGRPADYAISCSVPTVSLDAERERVVIAGLQTAQLVLANRHALAKQQSA